MPPILVFSDYKPRFPPHNRIRGSIHLSNQFTTTISLLMSRCPRICRSNSGDVLPSQIPKPINNSSGETDSGDPKVHPLPSKAESAMIDTLFAAVSAVKSAYMSLQQAHIPYQPNKLRVADALVISELESLSHLSNVYTSFLPSEIEQYGKLLAELQSRLDSFEPELHILRSQNEELNQHNAEINMLLSLRQEITTSVFADVVRFASDSVHEFAKPLISLMKASGWNLDRAADAIADGVVYSERSHKKYLFEAYLSRVMLAAKGDLNQWFELSQLDHVMSFRDPFGALLDEPDSGFGRFCRSKYIVAVHSQMELSFFGNLDQRSFVMSGGHPRMPFYQGFVRMARWVWALKVMADSFIPKAGMFCARRGQSYNEEYMESVVSAEGNRVREKWFKVGLTVVPGFKIGRHIIRCRVYLCRMES